MTRLARPLDSNAIAEADAAIYRRHQGDPRPNALYTVEGLRKPLDAQDPDQASPRAEWVRLYEQALPPASEPPPPVKPPNVNTPPGSARKPDQPVEPCAKLHWIKVTLVREADKSARPAYWPSGTSVPYADEPYNATLTNQSATSNLDSAGSARYDDIPCGSCRFRFPEFFQTIDEFFVEKLGVK